METKQFHEYGTVRGKSEPLILFLRPAVGWLLQLAPITTFQIAPRRPEGVFTTIGTFKKRLDKSYFCRSSSYTLFSSANTEFWPDLKTEPRHSPGHKSQIIWAIMEI